LPLLAVPVILNNTPLVIFWTIGRLEILHRLFERVLIPPKVHAEFLAIERESCEDALRAAGWIEVVSLRDPRRVLAYTALDEGEKERGLLESVRVVLDQLAEAGFFLEEQLRSEVLRLAGEAE
jgi:predicted nucleic acid-binding protein